MAITDWPAEERPREKLLALGAQHLSDAELLAIFLRTGIRGKSAVDLARELLNDYSGLRGLLELDCNTFCAHKGLGEAKFVQLQAVIEMASRHLQARLKRGESFTSPGLSRSYVQQRLRHYPHEVFACLFLDTRHRLLAYEELFRGTIDGASVHPREVVRAALKHNAAAVILAHNHPSGVAEPSAADRQITQRLKDALALVDVRVLDHIVVGEDAVSMAELGMV
ncbi:MAG: DNA repair protein RadC [Thiotrichales bacterium]